MRDSLQGEMKDSLQVVKENIQIEPKVNGHGPYISILPVLNSGGDNHRATGGLIEHLRAIRRRIWMIVGVTILTTLLAAVYMARQQDIYEAQARVQVDLENNPAVGVTGNSSAVASAPVNDPTYFSTQLQILTGTGLLRRVAKSLDLEHNKDFWQPQPNNTSSWHALLRMVGLEGVVPPTAQYRKDESPLPLKSVAPATASGDLEEARRLAPYVSALQRNLVAEPVKDTRVAVRETRLIDIRFSHQDALIATKVANAIANALVLSNLEKRTESSAFAGDFLQKRIAELQAKIRTDEERLLNYAQNNKILSLDPGQNTVVARLSALNATLLQAENDRKAAEAAYRTALAPGAADAMVQAQGSQNGISSTIAGLRLRRAQLLTETTEEWPEVKEIDKQIAELQRQLTEDTARQTNMVTTNLQSKYRQAVANEEALRKAFDQQRAETLTQNEAAINYRIIEQEIGTSKTLLDGLLQRSKENDVILAAIPNNIRVTDYALKPDRPVGPKRILAISVAWVCSLFVGIGLALLLGQLDDAIYSADELERLLNVPLLAAIPPAINLKDRFGIKLPSLHKSNGNGRSTLVIRDDLGSPFSESYRKLRNLLLRSSDGARPKTLLITSSIPSEGKTTTTINAAAVLASTGAKVLVIDADLRHPSHHSILDLHNEQGLSTVLAQELTGNDVLNCIQIDPDRGLSVLTSGPQTNTLAELIGSEGMGRLLATVSASFDHVIIDAPPIAYFADSALLASLVDGVVLVVGSGKTSRKVIRRSHKELQDVGANIIGMVLNNVKNRQQDYYSYYKAS
jgi:capsular exopolysaccharide synthesis family protein